MDRSAISVITICHIYIYILCTIVHYSCALLLYFTVAFIFFYVVLFSCHIFFKLHHFHIAIFFVVIFSCCTFFRVVLFLCIAPFHAALLHVAMFSLCILFLLHFSHVGIFSCCTFIMLHFFNIEKKNITLSTVNLLRFFFLSVYSFECLINKVERNQSTLLFSFLYINYIMHCKIKRDNHQIPKIVRVPRNKTNPKKKINKKLQIMQATTAMNTEFTDLWLCFKISCFHWKSRHQIF